ncbi:hypothetical protein AAEU32_15415 [Pseudoalteromonas sp. SSDWG2]|uniref:hypothetical protein n=1 Tax=Pseudoalteromonas sp. SSDWG2 TaxID=3139391 RepID=UPI003BAB8680
MSLVVQLNRTIYIYAPYMLVVLLVCVCTPWAQANAPQYVSPSVAHDCTGVEIAEIDPESLTKEERILLMENALLDSVNRYSTCLQKVQTEMAQSQSQSAGQDVSEAQDASNTPAENNSLTAQRPANETHSTMDNASSSEKEKREIGAGREQQVVAPKDNDSIICTMLYEEIQRETNDATRDALIKQYKDYNCTK